GLVGIKPTVGLWSRSAIIPISRTTDTAGPMARTVRDAAVFLGALRGGDPADPAPAANANQRGVDYRTRPESASLEGARLGVIREGLNLGPKTTALYEQILNRLKQAGAVLVDPTNLPDLEKTAMQPYMTLMVAEFRAGVEAYLATLDASAPK